MLRFGYVGTWSRYIEDGHGVWESFAVVDGQECERVRLVWSWGGVFDWCLLVPSEAVREDAVVGVEDVVEPFWALVLLEGFGSYDVDDVLVGCYQVRACRRYEPAVFFVAEHAYFAFPVDAVCHADYASSLGLIL
jgi:hypothetical protein